MPPGPKLKPFDSMYEKMPDGCWLWLGPPTKSKTPYGRYHHSYAHRKAYELFIGPIPPGMNVLHRCDVGICVNPEHLYLGTDTDNVRDRLERSPWSFPGRPLQDKCLRGHDLSGDNVYWAPAGHRVCRLCRRDDMRNRRAKEKISAAVLEKMLLKYQK